MDQGTIDEFRRGGGNVGGVFEGAQLLLLHHVGAQSGAKRVCPLMYQAVDGGYAIFASKGGADSNPHWFYNLRAEPATEIEIGPDTVAVRAREVTGEERDRIWSRQKVDRPQFAEYERITSRAVIPVVVLEVAQPGLSRTAAIRSRAARS